MQERNSSPVKFSLGKNDHHEEQEYVVVNSLPGSLHPKRVSEDIKLYLQLHKKIMRSVIIEKKFAQSKRNSLFFQNRTTNKGFRGSMVSGFAARKSLNSRASRIVTEVELQQRNSRLQSQPSYQDRSENSTKERHFFGRQAPRSQFKPNLMYNLTLYRKSFRRGKSYTEDFNAHVSQQIGQSEGSIGRSHARGRKVHTQF